MLIPYNTPISHPDAGITIVDFTLVTTLAGLKDGRPGKVTRLRWPAGAQSISTTASIEASFPTPIQPRVAGAIAISGLPAGLKCTIGWATAVGGLPDQHLQESTIVENVSGDLIVYDTWPAGLGEVYAYRLTFYNDVSGQVAVAAEQEIEIGELWASDSIQVDINSSGNVDNAEGTVTELSPSGQPYDAIQPARRRYTIAGVWDYIEKSMTDQNSIERIRLQLAQNPRTFFCPYEAPIDDVRQLAMYAKVTGRQTGLKDTPRYFESDWTFEELR